jgi:hypothetical protein
MFAFILSLRARVYVRKSGRAMNNSKIRISHNLLSIHELDAQGSHFGSLELEDKGTSFVMGRGSKPEGNSTVQVEILRKSDSRTYVVKLTRQCGVCSQRFGDRFRSIVRDIYWRT